MLPLISIPIDALPFAVQLAGAVQSAALFRSPGYGGHLHIAVSLFGQCSAHIYATIIIRPNDLGDQCRLATDYIHMSISAHALYTVPQALL